MDWWCQIAEEFPVGAPQRCLHTFAAVSDCADMAHKNFQEDVTIPLLTSLYTCLLRCVGPKVVGKLDQLKLKCSSGHDKVVENVDEILQMFKNELPLKKKCLKEAMPKGLYWLGTMVMANSLLEQLCPKVFAHFSDSAHSAESRRTNLFAPVLNLLPLSQGHVQRAETMARAVKNMYRSFG